MLLGFDLSEARCLVVVLDSSGFPEVLISQRCGLVAPVRYTAELFDGLLSSLEAEGHLSSGQTEAVINLTGKLEQDAEGIRAAAQSAGIGVLACGRSELMSWLVVDNSDSDALTLVDALLAGIPMAGAAERKKRATWYSGRAEAIERARRSLPVAYVQIEPAVCRLWGSEGSSGSGERKFDQWVAQYSRWDRSADMTRQFLYLLAVLVDSAGPVLTYLGLRTHCGAVVALTAGTVVIIVIIVPYFSNAGHRICCSRRQAAEAWSIFIGGAFALGLLHGLWRLPWQAPSWFGHWRCWLEAAAVVAVATSLTLWLGNALRRHCRSVYGCFLWRYPGVQLVCELMQVVALLNDMYESNGANRHAQAVVADKLGRAQCLFGKGTLYAHMDLGDDMRARVRRVSRVISLHISSLKDRAQGNGRADWLPVIIELKKLAAIVLTDAHDGLHGDAEEDRRVRIARRKSMTTQALKMLIALGAVFGVVAGARALGVLGPALPVAASAVAAVVLYRLVATLGLSVAPLRLVKMNRLFEYSCRRGEGISGASEDESIPPSAGADRLSVQSEVSLIGDKPNVHGNDGDWQHDSGN